MAEIYGQLQVPWRLLRIPIGDALEGANSGVVDGELARTSLAEAELGRLQRIPAAIGAVRIIAYTQIGAEKVETIGDLKSKRVALFRGAVVTDQLAKESTPVYADNVAGLFELLDKGRADVVMATKLDVDLYLNSVGKQSAYLASAPLLETKVYHFLHKRHSDLIKRLSQYMKGLQVSGELERIISKAELEVDYMQTARY